MTNRFISLLFFFFKAVVTDFRFLFKAKVRNPNKLVIQLSRMGITEPIEFYSSFEAQQLTHTVLEILDMKEAKVWECGSKSDVRLYGIDRVDSSFNSHLTDAFIHEICDSYMKSKSYVGFTLAARLSYKEGNTGSGGGWHRDRSDKKNVKSLTYLTQVNEQTGPFEYIKFSHSTLSILLDWIKFGINPLDTRISDEKVQKILAREPWRHQVITGEAGTLFFADTRGIHRGRPIESSQQRLALTNYFWYGKAIPEHIEVLVDQFVNSIPKT